MPGQRRGIMPQARSEEVERPPSDRNYECAPRSVTPRDGFEQRQAQLLRTIEVEIIPRLLLAGRANADGSFDPVEASGIIDADTVEEFVTLIRTHEMVVASAYFEAMRARGVSLEILYLHLLAPAARRLGELWSADLCDFTDVTVALGRLQQALRELSPAFRNEQEPREHGRRALLMPAPGEQHTFGLFMVAEFFRRAGWDVWGGPPASGNDLTGIVRAEWFDVVGLSVGCESRLDVLAAGIRAMRRASRNRAIGVMVGGPTFVEHPELVAFVGADATAADARQAALQAESLVSLLARPRRC
jgi:methanogenic corrinoid protein MtbC1